RGPTDLGAENPSVAGGTTHYTITGLSNARRRQHMISPWAAGEPLGIGNDSLIRPSRSSWACCVAPSCHGAVPPVSPRRRWRRGIVLTRHSGDVRDLRRSARVAQRERVAVDLVGRRVGEGREVCGLLLHHVVSAGLAGGSNRADREAV